VAAQRAATLLLANVIARRLCAEAIQDDGLLRPNAPRSYGVMGGPGLRAVWGGARGSRRLRRYECGKPPLARGLSTCVV